jgi:hypothetical protein
MADFKTRQKFRVGGSGFTAFYWNGKPIAFAQNVRVTAPQPVINPSVIQPMDARYPLQIITPGAIKEGYLDVGLLELYKTKVWDRLLEVAGVERAANDLADVFYALAGLNQPINAMKIIIPPASVQGEDIQPYGEMYHNCVITNIEDGETIDVRTMEIVKNVTIAYTHITRQGNDYSKYAEQLGNRAAVGDLRANYPSTDPYRGGFQDQ